MYATWLNTEVSVQMYRFATLCKKKLYWSIGLFYVRIISLPFEDHFLTLAVVTEISYSELKVTLSLHIK